MSLTAALSSRAGVVSRTAVASVSGAAPITPAPRLCARFAGMPLRARQAPRVVASRASLRAQAAAAPSETVRVNIQGRNVEVTDAMREYVQEKVQQAVGAFQGGIKSVDVTLSVRGGDSGTKGPQVHKADITIRTLRTGVVRVEDSEDNMYATIDLVCDKVQRVLRKTKEKAMKRGKWQGHSGSRDVVIADVVDSMDVVDELPLTKQPQLPKEVIRSKYFFVEPMTVEEATEQMEAVGHDFFVFQEVESGSVQVVYKRNTRGYGHIVPMLSQPNSN